MQTKTQKQNFVKKHFPQSRNDWRLYFSKTLPIIVGEILFCVNGFLDNFMVSHLPKAIDALTYANTWTSIIYTIFFAIQGIAAMFVGQYYGKKEYDKVNQVMAMRIWTFVVIAISLCLPSWINPSIMIKAVGGANVHAATLDIANKYLLLITISWLVTTYSFNTNMLLNEVGHSKYALVSSSLTLFSNVLLNALFLYVFKKPTYYAAIGSIISGVICLVSDMLFLYYKDRAIFVNPKNLFKISKPIAIQILKRVPSMILMIGAMITIPLRTFLWSRAYPQDSVGKVWMGISGVTILGLVESLSSIASAVTSACSSNVSYFVAMQLGQGNFKEAEKHAHALKGFHTLCGIFMSLIMLGAIYGIVYTPLITGGVEKNTIKYFQDPTNLAKIKAEFPQILSASDITQAFINERAKETIETFRLNFLRSCYTAIAFNPLWCWFYTSAALIRAGGRSYLSAFVTLIANTLSFVWLVIIAFAIVRHHSNVITLPIAYFLFYSFDFIRLIIFEVVAYKVDWKRNITEETENKNTNDFNNKLDIDKTEKDLVNNVNLKIS